MRTCIAMWLIFAGTLTAHPPPPAAPPRSTVPVLTLPAPPPPPPTKRMTLPERQGGQTIVDEPIVEDVFVQPIVRQRVTRLPAQYVEEVPMQMQMEFVPRAYAAPMPAFGHAQYMTTGVYAAPRYSVPMYAEPAGPYTKARYGPFGRLREVETTGDPRAVPRSTPGPVRTFFFGG